MGEPSASTRSDIEINSDDLIRNSSGYMIAFVGFSYVIISVLHYYFVIPDQYIIGVSFAAFFFVCTDFIGTLDNNKQVTSFFYNGFLMLAVFSFTILPVLIPSFENLNTALITSSESISIGSLGLVIVLYGIKISKAHNAYSNKIGGLVNISIKNAEDYKKFAEESRGSAKEYKTTAEELIQMGKEAKEVNNNLNQIIKESEASNGELHKLVKDTNKLNRDLVKMIEDSTDLEELKEALHK